MANHSNLGKAKVEKNDEFYTRYEDIEKEIMRYKDQFHGKTVLCNCDDPEWSNFWQFFHRNFSFFELKKLISTHYVESGSSYAQIYDGTRDKVVPLTRNDQINNNEQMNLFEMCDLEANGDFRSEECVKYLEEADIVVTNPPFSLLREFVATLENAGKRYLMIGNFNAISYKEVFPLIKENKMWLGYNWVKEFRKPDGSTQKFGNICWFTNLDTIKRHEDIILWKEYNEKDYPKYDNYDAINVDKVDDIPCDYYGCMGVPITFLDKYNPEQFEIFGVLQTDDDELAGIRSLRKYSDFKEMKQDMTCTGSSGKKANGHPVLKGKPEKGNFLFNEKTGEYVHSAYARIVIRRKYDNEGNKIN